MYLFKTSGATFRSVVENQKHAYPGKPRDWYAGEIALVSKNKKDLSAGEKQIRFLMRIQSIREIKPGEAELYWPGNEGRWSYLVECYDTIELDRPFSLEDILGKDAMKYGPVMTFKRIDHTDENIIMSYIEKRKYLNLPPIQQEKSLLKTELEMLNQDFRKASPKKKETFSTTIERNPRIISLLKRLHPTKCQICDSEHFLKKNGERYSEVHHITPLSVGGSQATDNCLVLCPTCHKKIHYASVEIEVMDERNIKVTINEEEFDVARNIISKSDLLE